MSVEIRRLKPEDAALAGELTLEYKRDAYAGILRAERLNELDLRQSIKLCKSLLKDSASNAVFAAFVNGMPAGMCAAGRLRWRKHIPPEYEGEIHSFYVKREFRPRYRLADRLWSHVIDWLEREKMKAVGFILEGNRSGRAYAKLRRGRIIAVKRGDGLWAGHNILIHSFEQSKRPIPHSELPQLAGD